MQNKSTLRKFIRHPSDVPIQVTLVEVPNEKKTKSSDKLNNVGLGGLAYLSQQALPKGQHVKVFFPLLDKVHSLSGKVVWIKPLLQGFDTGIQFENTDELYSFRMIEQVCHIEHYRKEIEQREGRILSSEEAASEWIKRYAGKFPGLEA